MSDTIDQEIRAILKGSIHPPNISDAHRTEKSAMKGIRLLVRGKNGRNRQFYCADFSRRLGQSPWEAIDIGKRRRRNRKFTTRIKILGLLGGLATQSSLNKGIAGVVIEGAARDIDEIENLGLPNLYQ